MYKQYYRLNQKPFSLLPNSDFLFMSDQHCTAMSTLDFGIMNETGFTVITGEIGAGKTTLVRNLLARVDEKKLTVGLLTNTLRSFGSLLEWILLAFNLEFSNKSDAERYKLFTDFLVSEYALGKRALLIIDEAQNMDPQAFEELRVLSNINADNDMIFQIILVGQPELRKTLQASDLEQFNQRIVADFHLESLSKSEVQKYIQHRMIMAGGRNDLFTNSACNYIAYYSKGVPRLVNMICDLALVYGYVDQLSEIGQEIVSEVINDKKKNGLVCLNETVSAVG